MRRMIDKILRQYGLAARVRHHGTLYDVRIFFQPSMAKTLQRMEPEVSPLGIVPRGQYLYIGPAGQDLAEGDEVHVGGKVYSVRRAEVYQDAGGPVYWWGLCVEGGVEDTWGK